MKVMILGATGMLGNAMLRVFLADHEKDTFATVRNEGARLLLPGIGKDRLITGVDVEQHDSIIKAFATVQPDVVINCIGLVKQLAEANDPLQAVPINSLLPHRLAALCKVANARLVHVSTDCVFSVAKGAYIETDIPDAKDLYGRTKLLGEVDYSNAITLRTSIIGHELSGAKSLIGWFLSASGPVKGFTHAIFSGLPTVVLSELVRDIVLPRPELHGLYHVASQAINKYDLLRLVAREYKSGVEIIPCDSLAIDRSLNAEKFRQATGYEPPDWSELIHRMHEFQ